MDFKGHALAFGKGGGKFLSNFGMGADFSFLDGVCFMAAKPPASQTRLFAERAPLLNFSLHGDQDGLATGPPSAGTTWVGRSAYLIENRIFSLYKMCSGVD